MSAPKKNKRKALTEAQRVANAARQEKVQKVQLILGYVIVAVSVVGGFALANPAVGIGLAVLAGFRLFVLRAELKKEASQTSVPSAELPSERGRRVPVSSR